MLGNTEADHIGDRRYIAQQLYDLIHCQFPLCSAIKRIGGNARLGEQQRTK